MERACKATSAIWNHWSNKSNSAFLNPFETKYGWCVTFSNVPYTSSKTMFSIVSVWLVKYAIETHSYLFKKLFWRQNQKRLVSLLPPHLHQGNILLKPLCLLTSVLPHWQIPDNFLSSPIPLLFLCTFLTLQDYQCSSKLAGMSTQHKVLLQGNEAQVSTAA